MTISLNSTKFKITVFDYLLTSTYDFESTEPQKIAQYIFDRFTVEYCYPDNLRRYPNTQQRLKEWLMGLPLNIEYANGSIVELYCKWRDMDANSLTDSHRERIVHGWFDLLARFLLKLWESFDIK